MAEVPLRKAFNDPNRDTLLKSLAISLTMFFPLCYKQRFDYGLPSGSLVQFAKVLSIDAIQLCAAKVGNHLDSREQNDFSTD